MFLSSINFEEQLNQIWTFMREPLFELSGNKISLMSGILAFFIFMAVLQAAKFAERLLKRALADKPLDPGLKSSLARFTRYGVLTVGVLITLDTLGVSLNSLAALSAVLMVGIGFGLQNITQNFISGLIILMERPIKVGDLVEVGGTTGRVHDVRARATIIHTRDDVAIIVPNSQFISEQVVNESFSGTKVRLHIKVGVAYGSDIEKVREVLLRVADAHSAVLKSPESVVFFEDFGDSSLNFDLCVWTNKMWTKALVSSEIRFGIDAAFRKEGIEIPFPQRDLHIKSGKL